MRFLLPLLFALSAVLPASAQEFTLPIDDVVLEEDAELPPIPAGWETVRGPFVVFHGASEDLDVLLRLSRHAEQVLPQLSRDLKVPLGGTTHVYLADSDTRFRALQPGRAPTWAEGVAYPSLGLVLLRSPSIRHGQSEPLEQVLRHELVHVLLGRAFAPNQPPTWLQEGLAQVWAGEVGPETTRTLSQGVASGSLLSLAGLSRGFPADPIRARVAYAQSADLIGWLRDEYGEAAVGELIRQLANGAEIEGAIHSATGDFIDDIDRRWRNRLESSGLSLGVLANTDLLMGLGGVLLVVGGVARRRRFHQRLAEMEAEEAALDDLIAQYLQNRRDFGVR
ncbi:MAG: peptidase MA family metallohydrolase [Myxococcota bacterium]